MIEKNSIHINRYPILHLITQFLVSYCFVIYFIKISYLFPTYTLEYPKTVLFAGIIMIALYCFLYQTKKVKIANEDLMLGIYSALINVLLSFLALRKIEYKILIDTAYFKERYIAEYSPILFFIPLMLYVLAFFSKKICMLFIMLSFIIYVALLIYTCTILFSTHMILGLVLPYIAFKAYNNNASKNIQKTITIIGLLYFVCLYVMYTLCALYETWIAHIEPSFLSVS